MRSVSNPDPASSGKQEEYLPLEERDQSTDRDPEGSNDARDAMHHIRTPPRRRRSLLAWCAIISLAFLYALSIPRSRTDEGGFPANVC